VLWAIAAAAVVGAAVPLYLIVRPTGRATWGLVEVAGVTLFFAGTLPLAGLLLPRGAAGGLPPLWLVVVLAVAQNAFFVAAATYVVAVKYKLPLAALGLRLDHARRRLIQGVAASVAAVLGNGLGQNLTVFLLAFSMGHAALGAAVHTRQQLLDTGARARKIPWSASMAERGRRTTLMWVNLAIVAFGLVMAPMFQAGIFGAVATMVLGMSLIGLVYGPLGTVLSELFPTSVRYTGSSLTFNLAGIFGASLAPYAATWLASNYGLQWVGYYLSASAMLSLAGLYLAPETRDRSLS